MQYKHNCYMKSDKKWKHRSTAVRENWNFKFYK